MLSGNRKSGGTAGRKTQIEALENRSRGGESISGVMTF